MFNIENQNVGCPSPMNTEYDTVLTGLREQKDRNLPEVMRGELGHLEKPQAVNLEATGPRMSGTVKWFNPTKGFGFITPDHGGLDVFVHQSEIQLPGFRSLAQGEPVEYQLYDGQKGPKALKVTGPKGKQVKGAPRQNKPKLEKTTDFDAEKLQTKPNLIQLASNYFQMANHVPVSTPVLAPTQALNALPSMTPTPASPQISHFIVTQQGLQNYYTTASDLTSFDLTATALPMSPTPMCMSPISPQPHYIPLTPVSQYTTATTPTPFAFPNQKQTGSMVSVMNSSPQTTFDYGFQMQVIAQENNPYDTTPMSFVDENAVVPMQISSPLSPVHV